MSAKNKLGQKRVCLSCEAKFYDLNNNPAICPKCGNEYDTSVLVKKKKSPTRKDAKDEDLLIAAANKAKIEVLPDAPKDELEDVDVHADIEDADEMDDVETITKISATDDDDLTSDGHTVEKGDIEGKIIVDEVDLDDDLDLDLDDED